MLIAFNRNYSVKKHTELFICSAKRSFFKVRVVTTSNNLLVNFRVVENRHLAVAICSCLLFQ